MSSERITDLVRGKELVATPEERVRQGMLEHLASLGYPRHLMQTEVKLKADSGKKTPHRRLDIVCYRPEKTGFSPLLLIECKAKYLGDSALAQLVGYNYFLKAPFICLASVSEIKCFSAADITRSIALPTYEEALHV